MTRRSRFMTILVLLALAAMLLMAAVGPAVAQDTGTDQQTTAESTNQGPASEATGFWLAGLIVIVGVGGYWMAKDHFKLPPPPDLDKSNH